MRAIAINRKVAKKHLQAQHQRPKVAHCNCRLSRKANKIIFAHRRELCVVSAGGVTWRVYPYDCMFLQRQWTHVICTLAVALLVSALMSFSLAPRLRTGRTVETKSSIFKAWDLFW